MDFSPDFVAWNSAKFPKKFQEKCGASNSLSLSEQILSTLFGLLSQHSHEQTKPDCFYFVLLMYCQWLPVVKFVFTHHICSNMSNNGLQWRREDLPSRCSKNMNHAQHNRFFIFCFDTSVEVFFWNPVDSLCFCCLPLSPPHVGMMSTHPWHGPLSLKDERETAADYCVWTQTDLCHCSNKRVSCLACLKYHGDVTVDAQISHVCVFLYIHAG